MQTITVRSTDIDFAIRNAKFGGYCFEARRRMMREARTHRNDPWFVRGMVASARTMNRSGVIAMSLARKWVS